MKLNGIKLNHPNSPPMSSSTQHSIPAQKRPHSSNDCRSNHPNSATHQRPASRQTQHRPAADCNVHVARKSSPTRSRRVFPDTMHLPVASQTTEIIQDHYEISFSHWIINGNSQSRSTSPQIPPSPDTRPFRPHPQPDRSNLSCVQCHSAESYRATLH